MTILCRSLPKSPEFMGRFGQCITILVNAGADLHHLCANAGNFIDEYSILHLLVRNGMDPKVVEIVVSHGVRLNFPDFNGCVPLHYAATLQGRVVAPYVEALLKLGANPNKQDSNGKSPMLLFAECQDSELALARMYERSGNPSIADKNGQNALHLACKQLKLRNISFLVEKIADVNSKDLEHKTAADLLFFNINQWRAGYNESDLISCVMKLLGHGGIVSIGVVQHQLIQYLRINDQNFHLPYPLAILDMVVNIHPFINLCSVKHKLAHLNHTLPDDVRRFFERLCSWNGPRSLQHLSRCVIRKCLGRRCGEAVHRLSLPKELHAYLSLCYNPDVN
ncbi:ankyrin repeat and SOCS box protein 4-like [Saccoglossus kowalevskii]